jgi:hypothetical protein
MLAYQPKDLNYIGKSNCNNCKLLFNKCLGALDATNCDLTIEGLQKIENYTTTFNQKINQEMFVNDPLSPARGIINGLLISIPIWIVVGLIVWWVTK